MGEQEGRRAAIYVRVSTTGQERDGTSLETQEQGCREYALAHGYQLEETHVYRETHSGADLWERDKLTALREAARHGEFDVVVCFAIDRLSRDPVHLGVIVSEADHYKVAVEFVSEPLDDSQEGQLIRYVRGYAAKVERAKIKDRTLTGKRSRVRGGKLHNHAPELYGYRRDKALGTRTVYEPEAAIVRSVFAWVSQEGASTHEVIRRLTGQGTPSPAQGKYAYASERPTYWGGTQVRRLLTNPAYKGETVLWRWRNQGNHKQTAVRPESDWIRLPEGTTPAIVDVALWDSAQARLVSNRGDQTRNQTTPYLLRGMVYCTCGQRMNAEPEHNLRVYRCYSRQRPTGPCGLGSGLCW